MSTSLLDFYASLDACLATDQAVAVATIVRTRGSSPREVGAKMLVRPSGQTDGTVGGGCGEADVWRAALDVMADQQPRMVVVDLTEEIAMNTDGVCGGVMDIFVEPWAAAGRHLTDPLRQAVGARQSAVLANVVSASDPRRVGAKLLLVNGQPLAGSLAWPTLERQVLADAPAIVADGHSQTRAYPDAWVYYELALPRPRLVLVGAGHVAMPTAEVARLLDFDVTVIDDRPTFANRQRFPSADEIVVDDFEAALERLTITPTSYVVLVTRGHVHDVRSLRRVIDSPAAYIGMIGSRRRVFAVFKLLHAEGVPIEKLLRVHAPIGLDIKTETPGEIAVSIGAELLKARRGGGAASFSDLLKPQYRYSLTRGEADL
jgi:xanthine dehydrogenase accessory factor